MALCGFNEKMLKGLRDFTEGLVEHGLIFKSKKHNETIEQAVRREISDMARLLFELNGIGDSAKRILTEGLIKYAQGFYLIMRKEEIKDYKELIGKIMDYFRFMDDKYYSELEGQVNDMESLVKLLNDKIIKFHGGKNEKQ